MVSSLTGMLKKIKHAKFKLKFCWGLGYNLQNASPFQRGKKSQITSEKEYGLMKTRWDFANHRFNFCLLCLLYDLGHITKLKTNFSWREDSEKNLKQNKKKERKNKEKEVRESHPSLCEGIPGYFLSIMEWCTPDSLLTEAFLTASKWDASVCR